MSRKRENNEIKFYDMKSDFNGNIKHLFEALMSTTTIITANSTNQ